MKELIFQYLDLISEDYSLYETDIRYTLLKKNPLKWFFEYVTDGESLWIKTYIVEDISQMFNIDFATCKKFIKEWGESFLSVKIDSVIMSSSEWIPHLEDVIKTGNVITEQIDNTNKLKNIIYEYINLVTENAKLLVDYGKNPIPGEYRIHFLNTKDNPPVKWFYNINPNSHFSFKINVGISLKFIQEISTTFNLDEDDSEKIIRNWYDDFLSEKVNNLIQKESKKSINENEEIIYLYDNKKMQNVILLFLDTLLSNTELVHTDNTWNRESKWIVDAKKDEWYIKCTPEYSYSYKINPILISEVTNFFGNNLRDIPHVIRLWAENIIGYKHGKTEVNANIGYDAIDEAIATAKEGKGIKISKLINKNNKENKMENILITKEQLTKLLGEMKKPITEAQAKLTCTYADYDKLDQFLGNKDERKIGNNTSVVKIDDFTIGIKLHNTYVIKIDPTNVMTLNSGGYTTNITKHRLGEFLYCRGVSIFSKKGDWVLNGPNGEFKFTDGMKVTSDGYIIEN